MKKRLTSMFFAAYILLGILGFFLVTFVGSHLLEARLEKLNDQTRKDDVVTFEQLGVDRLFVDESHNYKNLFLYTRT